MFMTIFNMSINKYSASYYSGSGCMYTVIYNFIRQMAEDKTTKKEMK